MKKEDNSKKHADFQDDYRRSSNFNNPIKDEDFKIKKNGTLKMEGEKEEDNLDESDKKRLKDAMDGVKKHK